MTAKLFIQAITKFLLGVVLVGVLLFLPAGTLLFFNGWLFMSILFIPMFFLRLQAVRRVDLYEHESVIIFDEVQLFPKARQAIKHLVKDGRYHYIETGSLISI